jgi:hypothetical protein
MWTVQEFGLACFKAGREFEKKEVELKVRSLLETALKPVKVTDSVWESIWKEKEARK